MDRGKIVDPGAYGEAIFEESTPSRWHRQLSVTKGEYVPPIAAIYTSPSTGRVT